MDYKMKKIKIYSFISLILGLIFVLLSVMIPILLTYRYTQQSGSIGIIGGAGYPTISWIISELGFGGYILLLFVIGIVLFLSGAFCLLFKKTVINNCSLKTTILSLTVSLFSAIGLICFITWYSIVVFHEMSKSPIAYPTSITGGLISLIAFIITIVFYFKARKSNFKVKGIVIDVLTIVIYLPIFFLFFLEVQKLVI